ncbi:ABC transporter ATP-binding protein [Falsiroseomonas selenitidurans]|uniref:ABC transporter ATP-binding protein n=1 Tax=Falsiroseomonas selenitidurans TaxID=2716335 RepID=A0ABX1E781_9PROT|nr:ABC transporter ATP-binding protein [Falsiroseomonas selenitidurans]NKC31387.1 ABC transporter ATP-binding protein [Falsiroseomonas selenitidurans]
MADPFLSIEAIDVFYGPVQALFGVSVTVGAGEVVAVLGGNASGKSTTVKAALGLVQPRQGRILLEGQRIDGLGTHQVIARGVASIPEGRRVFAEMTVEENLRLGAYARRGDPPAALAAALEEAFGLFPRLAERRRQAAGTLSGGEQQMLAMARAWMRRPRLLCIDEPSMGLSPLFVDHVYDVLARWKAAGLTILMVEQNANMALQLADRAYVLRNGAIVVQGAAAELAGDPELRKAYLGG